MTDEEAQLLCDECQSLFEFREEAEMFCIKLTDVSTHYFTLEIQPDFGNATLWTGRILACKKGSVAMTEMNKQDDRLQEKYRRALMEYGSHIKPFLENMAHLATLHRQPRYLLKVETMELIEIQYVWTNTEAEDLYRVYEGYVADIRQLYFPYKDTENNR